MPSMRSAALACALALAAPTIGAEPAGVDVVVAHYKEDLSWISKYATPGVRFRLYSKGAEPAESATVLPNVGRESHTYLTHIIRNYDSLAPWTVFTQGVTPEWGYRGGDSSSGHLTDRILFADYLRPFPDGKDSFFALSTATHLPRGIQSTRIGMLTDKLKNISNGLCPADGAGGWSDWWFDAKHPHHRAGKKMLEFYHQHVLQDGLAPAEMRRPLTIAFCQGARFSVSRERILSRPRAYYEALLEQVSQEIDPIQGYFLEAMWHDVFHAERPQSKGELCEYMPLPKGSAISPTMMYQVTARRLNIDGLASGFVAARSLMDAYVVETTEPPSEEVSTTEEMVATTEMMVATTEMMVATTEMVQVITTEPPEEEEAPGSTDEPEDDVAGSTDEPEDDVAGSTAEPVTEEHMSTTEAAHSAPESTTEGPMTMTDAPGGDDVEVTTSPSSLTTEPASQDPVMNPTEAPAAEFYEITAQVGLAFPDEETKTQACTSGTPAQNAIKSVLADQFGVDASTMNLGCLSRRLSAARRLAETTFEVKIQIPKVEGQAAPDVEAIATAASSLEVTALSSAISAALSEELGRTITIEVTSLTAEVTALPPADDDDSNGDREDVDEGDDSRAPAKLPVGAAALALAVLAAFLG